MVRITRNSNLLLIAGFCIALGTTFFFGYRAGQIAHRVRWENEPVRGWMSVPFVAHTHHVPEDVLFNAIHIPSDPQDRRPIREIAKEQHVPLSRLTSQLESAINISGEPGHR